MSDHAIASMWLVYTLSGSSVYTGIAGAVLFATQPLQVVLGPLIDRLSFRRLLVDTQTLQLAGVVVIPLAYWYELLSVWLLIAVMGTLELCNQIVYPAQNALLGGTLRVFVLDAVTFVIAIGAYGCACWTLCAALIAVWLDQPVWMVIVAFGLSNVPGGVLGVLTATLFQSAIATDRLGRILSIRNATSTLLLPLGAASGGLLAAASTPAIGFVLMAGAKLCAIALYSAHGRLRRLPAVTDIDERTLGLITPVPRSS